MLRKAIQFLGKLKDSLSAHHARALPTDYPRFIKVDVGTAYGSTTVMSHDETTRVPREIRSQLCPARHFGIARVSSTDRLEDLVQVRGCLRQ